MNSKIFLQFFILHFFSVCFGQNHSLGINTTFNFNNLIVQKGQNFGMGISYSYRLIEMQNFELKIGGKLNMNNYSRNDYFNYPNVLGVNIPYYSNSYKHRIRTMEFSIPVAPLFILNLGNAKYDSEIKLKMGLGVGITSFLYNQALVKDSSDHTVIIGKGLRTKRFSDVIKLEDYLFVGVSIKRFEVMLSFESFFMTVANQNKRYYYYTDKLYSFNRIGLSLNYML